MVEVVFINIEKPKRDSACRSGNCAALSMLASARVYKYFHLSLSFHA